MKPKISVTAHAVKMHTSVKHPGTAATKDTTSAWVVKPQEPNELGPPRNIPRQGVSFSSSRKNIHRLVNMETAEVLCVVCSFELTVPVSYLYWISDDGRLRLDSFGIGRLGERREKSMQGGVTSNICG